MVGQYEGGSTRSESLVVLFLVLVLVRCLFLFLFLFRRSGLLLVNCWLIMSSCPSACNSSIARRKRVAWKARVVVNPEIIFS